jgi:hypothetical protein
MNHPVTNGVGVWPLRAALAVTLVLTAPWWSNGANAETSEPTAERAGAPATSPHASEIGEATRAWLALQRSNAAAAPALPTPGAEATLAYERYMNSFRTRIPASFGSTLSVRNDGNGAGGASYESGAAPSPDMH